MPTGGLDFVALATAAAEAGAVGAGLGAVGSAITGGDPLKGAEMGGLSGLGIGAGGFLGPVAGIGATAGSALGGAAGGALGGAATGSNPLFGALEGAAGGAISANTGDIFGGTSNAPPGGGTAGGGGGGATPGAAATAAPAGISGGGGDVTFESSFPTGVNGASSGGSEIGSAISSSSGGGSGGLTAPSGGINVGTPSVDNIAAGSISTPGGGVSGASGGLDNISGAGAGVNNVSGAGGAASGGGNSIAQAFKTGSGSDILSALSKNSNILLPAAGLGFNAIEGNQSPKNLKTLQGQADRLAGQGSQLESYLQTGTLPPGVQGSLNQASQSAKAAIKSRYASMGASGSSAEQQELANVDATSASQGANLALNLLQQGVQESQLSSVLYEEIMKTTMQQDQNLQSAVTNFATAAAGGGSGTHAGG